MSSYPVVANDDISPQMNRVIGQYMENNDVGPELANVMRDTVVNILVLRGMTAQKVIQQAELRMVLQASWTHLREALLYRQELLADEKLDDFSRNYLDAFTQQTLGVMTSNFKQSAKTFGDTTAEIAERRPNPRSEGLIARVTTPALPPPRQIAVRPAGWLEKLSRQTFVIED